MTVDNVAPILPEIQDLSPPLSTLLDIEIDSFTNDGVAGETKSTPPVDASASTIPPAQAAAAPRQLVLLPMPTLSENNTKISFAPADPGDKVSQDLANAGLTVAHDGSFVEATTGAAAMELKRLYDQQFGVGKGGVKSPYAITSLVNQHGKDVHRIGLRDIVAATDPSAAPDREEDFISAPHRSVTDSPESSRSTARRSQIMSFVFNKPSTSSSSSRPTTANSSQQNHPRKLKKTRSIPDGLRTGTTTPGDFTGRAHSQSLTAEVSPFAGRASAPPRKAKDIFGEVMAWDATSSRSSSFSAQGLGSAGSAGSSANSHTSSSDHRFPRTIQHPFGLGVSFDLPSRKLPTPAEYEHLRTPRLLREMQSFESGLTARQTDGDELPPEPSPAYSAYSDMARPPSIIRIRDSYLAHQRKSPTPPSSHPPSVKEEEESHQEPTTDPVDRYEFAPATLVFSRYSTDVFDVLQTSRGLPLLEMLDSGSEGATVIKMSLASDDSAAPRDDPRFVIWGHVAPNSGSVVEDDASLSQGSLAEFGANSGSAHSSISNRKSLPGSKPKPKQIQIPDLPNLHLSVSSNSSGQPALGTERVLIAATIERWIAQLTSVLNYDELLHFFLTYRTYVSAVDLCHLLISRFHWTLLKPTSNSISDAQIRRVVRVRTFVAIRYWLLTFFIVDFLPNRELRLLFADWLNTLAKDPILLKHNDGVSTIKKLIKVAKDCKKAHTRPPTKPVTRRASVKPDKDKEERLFGENFAEATRKLKAARPGVEEPDENNDVDFDFEADGGFMVPVQTDTVNAHLSTLHLGATLSPSGPTSIPLSSLNILHQTEHAPGPGMDSSVEMVPFVPASPIHHGTLSRVLVKTFGRIGKWRRVLNNKTGGEARNLSRTSSLGACADVSAFDLELSVSPADILADGGRVDDYLLVNGRTAGSGMSHLPLKALSSVPSATVQPPSPVIPASIISTADGTSTTTPTSELEAGDITIQEQAPTPPTDDPTMVEPTPSAPAEAPPDYNESILQSPPGLGGHRKSLAASVQSVDSEQERDDASISTDAESVDEPDSDSISFSSTSTDSFGEPVQARAFQAPFAFDVVSIDDLDLSDGSSDENVAAEGPPGLRNPTRRLPLRRDFEFIRRPESVSSMGIHSRDSVHSTASSTTSSASIALGGNIQQWQMNALVDSLTDNGEEGDVDAALRRLEGQINPTRQRDKVAKVDGWVKNIRARMAAGDYSEELPRWMDDYDDSDEEGTSDNSDHEGDRTTSVDQPSISIAMPVIHGQPDDDVIFPENSITPVLSPTPGSISPTRKSDSGDAKPAIEDAVPLEILQSRVSQSASPPPPFPAPSMTSKFSASEPQRVHRSFILGHRAEVLAQHFAMIDRELYMGVKFEELVLDDWLSCEEVDIQDWAQYLKDRARWKAEGRYPEKTSALAAVRARFNLMANFTISEVVLSLPSERPVVVGKFLRLAWKSYCLQSFNTVVAIIAGLQSEWTSAAMRKQWNRLGIWETRVFNDLKLWASAADSFRYIRQTITAIADAKPLDSSSRVASVSGSEHHSRAKSQSDNKPILPSTCVPFIGVYLAQLRRYSKLPDLIDPTSPTMAVSVDPETSHFDSPARPEVFASLAPLPPTIHLEPLINVHKQRLIAGVIQSLVASQHLASRLQLPVDKKLFQKCLRLRGLDTERLHLALSMYSD